MTPIRVEDLMTTLGNQKVVDAISAAIQPMIEVAIAEALNKRVAEPQLFTTVVYNFRPDITARNVKMLTSEKQNIKLRAAVDSQQQRIEAPEATTRLENLVVYGLSPSYAETSTTGLGGELNDDVNHPSESSRRSEKSSSTSVMKN